MSLVEPTQDAFGRIVIRLGETPPRGWKNQSSIGYPEAMMTVMVADPSLVPLGWDDRVAQRIAEVAVPDCVPARVVRVDLDSCTIATGHGDHRDRTRMLPAVGDWVMASIRGEAAVAAVARRWSELARRGPTGLTQVLAANVDLVFVTAPADRLSPARVERETAIAWDSGARPVVLLTKCDLAQPGLVDELGARLNGVEVVAVSTVTGEGAEEVAAALRPSRTAVLMGPSGAGKSSLTNLLLGRELLATGPVRAGDRRGRHVTSARELFVVPSGGVLIDTPGLRSLSPAADHGGVAAAFPDIEALALECRFPDCRHEQEPDCAVLDAERAGALDSSRLINYRKLRRELDFEVRRDDPTVARQTRQIWKARSKAARRMYRERGH
jgi:ribosome biogenesis GTPase